jgi:serine/threonine protein kinase
MEIIFDEPINSKRAYREIRILNHLRHPSIVGLCDVISPVLEDYAKKQSKNRQLESSLKESKSYYSTPTSSYDENRNGSNNNSSSNSSSSYKYGNHNFIQIPRNLGSIFLVFEYMDTDLSKIIKSNQYLSDEHVQYILYQVLDGIRYLHNHNIIHRDLKPANILVNCIDCTIKIADFGLARVVDNEFMPLKQSTNGSSSFDYPSSTTTTSATSSEAAAKSSLTAQRNHHQLTSMRRFQNLSNDSLDGGAGVNAGFGSICINGSISTSNDSHAVPSSSVITSHDSERIAPAKPTLRRSLTKHVVTRW